MMKSENSQKDIDKDFEWYAKGTLKGAFSITIMILFFCFPFIFNYLGEYFRNDVVFHFLGKQFILYSINHKIFLDIKPYIIAWIILIISIIVNHAFFSVTKYVKDGNNKLKLLSISVFFNEVCLLSEIHYTGGIESPMLYTFLFFHALIITIVRSEAVKIHAISLVLGLLCLILLEYFEIIGHVNIYTPAIGLYNNTAFVVVCILSIIFLFLLMNIGVENAIRKSLEQASLKSTFYRYMSPKVAAEVLEKGNIELGGENRTVTTLFADIRDFTKYTEKSKPEQVVKHLNVFFTEMVSIVFNHEGTLDKFMGDAIMATFGVPKDHPDDEIRACKAALEMKEALKKLNKRWESEFRHQFHIGIGINTGEAVAGNIGSEQRMEFTVIGDSVNTASRLEQLTKDYPAEIIISESTYQAVKDKVEAKPLDRVTLKGKSEPIQMYELVGLR
jgi:class 3 adenylate cyclase